MLGLTKDETSAWTDSSKWPGALCWEEQGGLCTEGRGELWITESLVGVNMGNDDICMLYACCVSNTYSR